MDRFETTKLQIKEATDLVALVESYIPVRKAGRNLTALCPFHQEKTPSFTLYPDSQHYKCYGCGKAGDVFSFVMEREGLSFREGMELLAQRVGISTEGVFRGGGGDRSPRVDVHGMLGQVRDFFHAVLKSDAGTRARQYLEERGLSGGIEAFSLGAHPAQQGALAKFAHERKIPREVLEQAGLLRDRREPFRGRLMFPIEDARGRVVGFGGRALDDAPAKYLNSPESPIFNKRNLLYGLRSVKDAGERRVVVMEGYTDVIACHLAGFRGAVATLGTALTPAHGRLLLRYATDGVVLLFDGDRAGRAAAEKAYGELVKTDLPLRTALLDEGTDPADLLAPRADRSEEELAEARQHFTEILEGAEDALNMWFRLKRKRMDLRQEVHVGRAVEECARVLTGIEDPTRGAVLIARMAQQLGVSESVFRKSLSQVASRSRPAQPEEPSPQPPQVEPQTPSAMQAADYDLLACVLAEPSLAPLAAAESNLEEAISGLLDAAGEAVGQGVKDRDAVLSFLFTRCAEAPESGKILAACAELARTLKEPEEAFDLLCRNRRAYLAKRKAQQLRLEIQQARAEGDQARVNELTRRYMQELRAQGATPT